jgi:hypothetical protein
MQAGTVTIQANTNTAIAAKLREKFFCPFFGWSSDYLQRSLAEHALLVPG